MNTARLTEIASSWLLFLETNRSWVIGVTPVAALIVWLVARMTRDTEGEAILYAGIAMGLGQLAIAAWMIWR